MYASLLETVDGHQEDARERLPNVRYNMKMLEFLVQQMGKVCVDQLAVERDQAPWEGGMLTAYSAWEGHCHGVGKKQGRAGHGGRVRQLDRLESLLKRGVGLITKNTITPNSKNFQRVCAVKEEVEEICGQLEASVEELVGRGWCERASEPIQKAVPEGRVLQDKTYLYYYLKLIVQYEDGVAALSDADLNGGLQREWALVRAEHEAQRQYLPWFVDEGYDEWREEDLIGSGGCGVVFRAIWRDVNVAIRKYTGVSRQFSHEALASFFCEAEIQRSMASPYVVRIYAVSETGAVIMELARCSMSDLRESYGELPWSTKLQLLLEAAEALRFLHDQGVVHGNVKGRNFLLFGKNLTDFSVKVADFGMVSIKAELKCKNTALQYKSSRWDAPEVHAGQMADFRSDAFSFGVVMFEVAAQRVPYEGIGSQDLLVGRKMREIVPCRVPDDCPPTLLDLMRHCIRSDPGARPTLAEVVATLKELVENVSRGCVCLKKLDTGLKYCTFDLFVICGAQKVPLACAPAVRNFVHIALLMQFPVFCKAKLLN